MATEAKHVAEMTRGNGAHAMEIAERASSTLAPEAATPSIDVRENLVVTAEELGYEQVSGPKADVPEDLRALAHEWIESYRGYLADRLTAYMARHAAVQSNQQRDVSPEIGNVTVGTYVPFDVLSLSPIEIPSLPHQQPNKVIPGGKLTLFLALLWHNPLVSIPEGYAVAANIQVGGRTARLSFDNFNLTTGVPTSASFIFGLPTPAPALVLAGFFGFAPVVATPQLNLLNVTYDIVDATQPFSAFATWHADIDNEPSWFGGFPPSVGPGLQHDTENKWMVYPE